MNGKNFGSIGFKENKALALSMQFQEKAKNNGKIEQNFENENLK